MAEKVSSKSTQEFVPIEEIRDGIAILKDGSMRAVIMTSSLNFALKSEDEQNAIILQFQNFLNSLNFSIQIFMQSRRLDIRPYIALLEGRLKEQTNDLLRIQIREYIQFIRSFTEQTNIMTKTFFVVIPYAPPALTIGKGGPFGGKKDKKSKAEEKQHTFEENRTQLEKRISVVEQGIQACGIRIAPLGTEELIEVFYKLFNPGDVEKPIPAATA